MTDELNNMADSTTQKQGAGAKGIIPFVTEVARYFMDFLETDFHKVRNPKRHIQIGCSHHRFFPPDKSVFYHKIRKTQRGLSEMA